MTQKQYGQTHNLQIEYDRPASVVYFTGQRISNSEPFEATLTKRAMHLLWYRLTQGLYPHEAPTMIGTAGTAPLRSPAGQPMTTRIEMKRIENGNFEIIGGMMNAEWLIQITEADARRLWAELDIILFPYGWEGREGSSGRGAAV